MNVPQIAETSSPQPADSTETLKASERAAPRAKALELNNASVSRALRDMAKANIALAEALDGVPAAVEKRKVPLIVDDGEISAADKQRAKAALKARGYSVP